MSSKFNSIHLKKEDEKYSEFRLPWEPNRRNIIIVHHEHRIITIKVKQSAQDLAFDSDSRSTINNCYTLLLSERFEKKKLRTSQQ